MSKGTIINSGRDIHINYTSNYNKLTKTHVNHDVCKPSFLNSLCYSSSKNKPFIDNRIKTAKYSALSFIPLQLWFQFKKIANLYFILISALQLVPNWSPTVITSSKIHIKILGKIHYYSPLIYICVNFNVKGGL